MNLSAANASYSDSFLGYWFVWIPVWHDGSLTFAVPNECATRDYALECIDAHYAGGSKVHTVEIEYINPHLK